MYSGEEDLRNPKGIGVQCYMTEVSQLLAPLRLRNPKLAEPVIAETAFRQIEKNDPKWYNSCLPRGTFEVALGYVLRLFRGFLGAFVLPGNMQPLGPWRVRRF